MIGSRRCAVFVVAASLALVASACGGSTTGASQSGTEPTRGGTIREGLPEFGWTDAFDPTGEYMGYAWGLYDQLLMRGLMTYRHTSAENGGDTPVPDLATGAPTISSDRTTYDFTLKGNVRWSPPLNRTVTSTDIYHAFQRINDADLLAQYGNYYCGVIQGMNCQAKDDGQPISGIKTPDDTHISFTLERPTGDFLYRLAMPATKAIPVEVRGCFPKAGDYGVDVISSGPYMIMGQDNLDLTSCSTIEPISGYDVNNGMTLVRNPNWDSATDENRAAYANGIQLKINTNVGDEFNRLIAGDLDVVEGPPPTKVLRDFQTNDQYRGWLHADQGDRTWYVTMNLLAPPFDDVHVRKAVNLALDKEGIRKQFGGSLQGDLATSVEPPTVLPQSTDINPYSDNTGQGNADAAMAEMKQSRYDTNRNGACDDGGACDDILFLGVSTTPWPNVNQIALASLRPVLPGLVLREVDMGTMFTTLQQVKKLVPISIAGWGKDYASPYGFDFFIFDSAGISCNATVNYSLVGISADQAKECGIERQYDAYISNYGPVPSVDDKMDQCVGNPADQVDACFAEMDTYLMETAVPWAPWLWATNFTSINPGTVLHYEYDQNAGTISYVNTSVNNELVPESVA